MRHSTRVWALLVVATLAAACTAEPPSAAPTQVVIASPSDAPGSGAPSSAPATTVGPSPSPFIQTPYPGAVATAGTGVIEFGLGYDDETEQLIDKRSSFPATLARFAYQASFSRDAWYPITTTFSRIRPGEPEELVYTETAVTDDPAVKIQVGGRSRIPRKVDHVPGTYVMRIYAGLTAVGSPMLAEGVFTLT